MYLPLQEHLKGVEFIDAGDIEQAPWFPHYDAGNATDKREVHDLVEVNKMYSFKSFSLYYTSFDEALFLDSDSVPMQDPATFFEAEDYQKHGNQFCKDHVYQYHTGPWLRDGAYLIHLQTPLDRLPRGVAAGRAWRVPLQQVRLCF